MIYIEKSALILPLAKEVEKGNYSYEIVEDGFIPEDSKTNILITNNKDNFVHRCPATNNYKCCNYYVADIMQGCPFDCSYCILQAYLPHKYIKVTADMDSIKNSIELSVKDKKKRIGTGELADSLALDHIIPLSKFIIPIANHNDNIQFEFKTKSANIGNLLSTNPKNIIVSWSLNPQKIIDLEEPFTAPLDKRLEAAKEVIKAGFKVAFHLDPLIMIKDFQKVYTTLIDKLTNTIDEQYVEFISISTFRGPLTLIDAVRTRPKESILTKGDFIRGIDGKIRYFKTIRIEMIKYVYNLLKKSWKKPFIYFCMEHETLWHSLQNIDPGEREEFEKLFPFYNKVCL